MSERAVERRREPGRSGLLVPAGRPLGFDFSRFLNPTCHERDG
jgi:hypothetical protein